MSDPHKNNAVDRRLGRLRELWQEFADHKTARVLRWLAANDERQMVDAFLQIEDGEAGVLPVLFVRLPRPFQDPRAYGRALHEDLLALYRDSKDQLAAEHGIGDWQPQKAVANLFGPEALAHSCISFQKHCGQVVETLCAVLWPTSVADVYTWRLFVQGLTNIDIPANVRFLVLDSPEAPQLDEMEPAGDRLLSQVLALKMNHAYGELTKHYGGEGPDAEFRNHFVALAGAASTKDLVAAGRSAEAALAVAKQHGWVDQQVVVQLTLGAAYIGSGRTDDALACYAAARENLRSAKPEDVPAAAKLGLQVQLSSAAALVGAGRFEEAGQTYEAAAPAAKEIGDALMELESWRMASYCKLQVKQRDAAWTAGLHALDAGAALEQEARASSTLPYLAQHMIRLAADRSMEEEEQVRQRLVQLLGDGWEARSPAGSAR